MTTAAPPAVDAPLRRRPRATLWLLRLLITVHVLAVTAQPVLAGLFLTGDVDAIEVHGAVGTGIAAFDLLIVVAALAYAGSGGSWWVPLAATALFLAVGLQVGMGYARLLQVHIPLGVAVVTISVLLVWWVWSPAAGRGRGAR